jgi:hypothetical protein
MSNPTIKIKTEIDKTENGKRTTIVTVVAAKAKNTQGIKTNSSISGTEIFFGKRRCFFVKRLRHFSQRLINCVARRILVFSFP